MGAILATRSPVAGTFFPAGVTLRAIDGGPTFYASNGFTQAAAAGFDNPSFFPIGLFLEKCRDQTDADKWAFLGCNTALAVQGDVSFTTLQTNNISLVIQAEEWLVDHGNNLFHHTLAGETVGINAADEPATYADAISAIQDFPNAQQDTRFFYENYTHNQVTFGDVEGHDMDDLLSDLIATPNASTRHLTIASVDMYFYAGSVTVNWRGPAGNLYNLGRDMTADEMKRGCHYGDIIDMVKGNNPNSHPAWQTTYPAPFSVFVETGTPYNEDTTEATAIRPAQINAAVWGSIIHGARFVQYFTLGDGLSWNSGGLIGSSFWDTPYNGESISNYDQVAATNALVQSLATVINSPFADGFVTVSPPAVRITASVADSGFDVMAKYHNVTGGNNKFYIFAMPRYSEATTNQTATFTIKNTGATQVTVINEARTISITGGGTTFADNFALGSTVHIYRVD